MQVLCMFSARLISILRTLLALMVLDSFKLALAMEVSPELHRKIHQDADDGDHDCFVTLLQHGGLESVLVAVLPAPIPGEWTAVVWTGSPIRLGSFFLTCSIYEHGPPVAA